MLVLEIGMPTGVYLRTNKHLNKGNFKKGSIPHNLNKQTEKVLKKVEKVRLGLSVECKHHGEHFKWRLHTDNNVQCLHCSAQHQRNRKIKDPLKIIFLHAKRHAKVKGREFSITLENLRELLILQENRCALSYEMFSNEKLPSLDRIDASKGYIKENVQLLQIKVNVMKSNLDQDEFISLCGLIAKKRKKK